MTHTNAQIYGPPAHTPTEFSFRVKLVGDSWGILYVAAYADTHTSSIWSLRDVVSIPDDDDAHLLMAAELYALVSDMMYHRPGTQERAQFVANGGIYGRQATLF